MNATVEYRIEGQRDCGWILFDRTPDESYAKMFLSDWRKARLGLKFRLVMVTTTISREVVEED